MKKGFTHSCRFYTPLHFTHFLTIKLEKKKGKMEVVEDEEMIEKERIVFEETKKKAEGGCVNSKIELLLFIYYGIGRKRSKKEAIKMCQELYKETGDLFSSCLIVHYGWDKERDSHTAYALLKKVLEKKYNLLSDFLKAQVDQMLGYCLREGIACPEDVEGSIAMYKKASENHPNAMCNLGQFYETNYKNYKRAYQLYCKAAKRGFGNAFLCIGTMHYVGRHVEQDYRKAVLYYEHAISLGEDTAFTLMGNIYRDGILGEKDVMKAIEFYQKGVDAGSDSACFSLALIHKKGVGVEQDLSKTFLLYEMAAKRGHASSMNNLALMYENGEGVQRSLEKAFFWYQQAANKNHPSAHYNIGV